jgi:hypothetical protein
MPLTERSGAAIPSLTGSSSSSAGVVGSAASAGVALRVPPFLAALAASFASFTIRFFSSFPALATFFPSSVDCFSAAFDAAFDAAFSIIADGPSFSDPIEEIRLAESKPTKGLGAAGGPAFAVCERATELCGAFFFAALLVLAVFTAAAEESSAAVTDTSFFFWRQSSAETKGPERGRDKPSARENPFHVVVVRDHD